MINSRQILTTDEASMLRSLVGQQWENMSSNGMVEATLSWDPIRIATSESAIEIALDLEFYDIYGEPDEYPVLRVRPAGEMSPQAISNGYVYFQGKGQKIEQVWILREKLSNVVNGQVEFQNESDIALSFKLEKTWISLVRATHFSDVFDVWQSTERDAIELPDTVSEWEDDLFDQFELAREWIHVA